MEDQIKQLTKEKYQLDLKIEKLASEYIELTNENEILRSKQRSLKDQENSITEVFFSNNNNTIVSSDKDNKMIKDVLLNEDPDIKELKQNLQDIEFQYNSKIEYLKLLKDYQRIYKDQNSDIISLIEQYSELEKENTELDKDNKELSNKVVKLDSKTFSECIDYFEKYKKEEEKLISNINSTKTNLNEIISKLEKIEKEYNQIQVGKESINNELITLFIDKKELEFQFEAILSDIDDLKTLVYSSESEIDQINIKLLNNKDYLEDKELELNSIYYFIKYSNSFINSVFNIINTRKIQIELISKFNMNPDIMDKQAFEKLDSTEKELISEYKIALENLKKNVEVKKENN